LALLIVGVQRDTEVLTQALSFVATANAISYLGALPVFIDSANDNLGMCPNSLKNFLEKNVTVDSAGLAINKQTQRRISACVPMHVFGNPVKILQIQEICTKYKIPIVEDAAESLGSFFQGTHTGLFGQLGILSFNGNKIATSGGGGMIVTNDEKLAQRAKHLSTTARQSHKWEFYHDEIGYNYRLPNLNAALACAQIESLPQYLENKKQTAGLYRDFFQNSAFKFIDQQSGCESNFWLNAIQLNNFDEREKFLQATNDQGVMTRPIWKLMTDLPAFSKCYKMPLPNAEKFLQTVVNLPSNR
jgi:aminotransferase in exopolysaccharide biosynthesis